MKIRGIVLFLLGLTVVPTVVGCGLAFSKTDFLDATSEGRLRWGQSIEEVREIVGKPDSTRSTAISGTPYEVWIYKQTTRSDKSGYIFLTIFSMGLAGVMPVGASEQHYIVFENGKVVSWDSFPGHLSKQSTGQIDTRTQSLNIMNDMIVSPVLMPPQVPSSVQRLAVIPLSKTTDNEVPAYVDFAINLIRQRQPKLVLVERDTIGKLLDEMTIQHSGQVDDELTVRLGKMVGATTLLTYNAEQFDRVKILPITLNGGLVSGTVEFRLVDVEKGVALFRQVVTGSVSYPYPTSGATWTEEGVYRASKLTIETAAAYGLAALVAAFGENSVGIVPSLNTKDSFMVLGVLDGSPVQIAGVRKWDKILSVNGQPMRSWVDPIPLPTTLTIEREGRKLQFEVMTRH
jgi:hypothetical protein